jgi:hypothetical protein
VVGARRAGDGRPDARPSTTVPDPPLPAGVHVLTVGPGLEALLAVPPGPAAARPLLVFFHGAGATAQQGSLRSVGWPPGGASSCWPQRRSAVPGISSPAVSAVTSLFSTPPSPRCRGRMRYLAVVVRAM